LIGWQPRTDPWPIDGSSVPDLWLPGAPQSGPPPLAEYSGEKAQTLYRPNSTHQEAEYDKNPQHRTESNPESYMDRKIDRKTGPSENRQVARSITERTRSQESTLCPVHRVFCDERAVNPSSPLGTGEVTPPTTKSPKTPSITQHFKPSIHSSESRFHGPFVPCIADYFLDSRILILCGKHQRTYLP